MNECYYCGGPLGGDCVLRFDEVEVGRSGGSWTFRGGGGNSSNAVGRVNTRRKGATVSYNTGRKYYRKQRIYVCADCNDTIVMVSRIKFWIGFVLGISLVVYAMYITQPAWNKFHPHFKDRVEELKRHGLDVNGNPIHSNYDKEYREKLLRDAELSKWKSEM